MTGTYRYDVFGVVRQYEGPADTQFRFTGEQWDTETDFYYLRARYYDPAIGRFVSRDPWPGLAEFPQSLNGYPYVVNNPVNLTDPSGLDCGLSHPWECRGGIPIPIWPVVPMEAPDIPIEFNLNPAENAKAWWDRIRGSEEQPQSRHELYPKEDMVQPWTPASPGDLLPPNFRPPIKDPGKWMWRAILVGVAGYAAEQFGIFDMCVAPKE